MSKDYEAIDRALRAVAPVVGVRFVREDDPSTWEVQFDEDATDEQKQAAAALVQTMTLQEAVPTPDPIEVRLAALEVKSAQMDTAIGVLGR
jgi:hypothetical protein